MSKLNINEDLFLEKVELQRLQGFFNEEGVMRRDLLKAKAFGVLLGDSFKVSSHDSNTKVKISQISNFAINNLGKVIYSDNI